MLKEKRINVFLFDFVDEMSGTGLFNEGKWEKGMERIFLIIKRETY